MKIDLDAILGAAHKPWTLTVNLGGSEYALRELTDKDIPTLNSIGGTDLAAQRGFVSGLIIGESKPPPEQLAELPEPVVVAIVASALHYFTQRKGLISREAERIIKRQMELDGGLRPGELDR